MFRIRFHGRGGQGAKVASRVLGTAAFFEGYYAQDFPLYGAERRGAPIIAFTRISREPILERGIISEPDVVIIMDETILNDPAIRPLSGLKKEGAVFINTPLSSGDVKEKFKVTSQVITLDITKTSLDMLGRPVLSALAGGVAARITGINEDSLRKGVEKEILEITADRNLLEKNIEASLYCFNAIKPAKVEIAEGIRKRNPLFVMPFEPAIISSPAINAYGNTPLRKTGNWRIFRPVWDYNICTKCMACVVSCPDGRILVNEEGFPYTDYDNCKGCLICEEVCPADAIGQERELHV